MPFDMASQQGTGSGAGTFHHQQSASLGVALPKKLIICCDGTWMDSDNGYVSGGWFSKGHMQNPTNVTRIARAMCAEDDNHHPQIVYYQAGIGSGLGLTNQLVGGGTGLGLTENIREAYAFLVNNYRVNDPDQLVAPDAIFLLGFSRGAFTARSIGGLLGAIGLLKKKVMMHFYEAVSDWFNAGSKDYTPLFFDSYFAANKDQAKVKPSDELARDQSKVKQYLAEYKSLLLSLDLTQDVEIKCIGVWDTVGALGVPVNPIFQKLLPFLPTFVHEYSWFDTGLSENIKNAFQALALDEHRFPFSPTLWEKPEGCTTNLKQTWFPGAHSNVGGSYTDQGIADITLAWMMDQLSGNTTPHPKGFIHHDWIKFEADAIDRWYRSVDTYLTQADELAYRGWSLGHVYQSNTFPESLAGSRVRSPGRYHRIFYDSGRADPKNMLRDTNETMHPCVRVRVQRKGRGVEPDTAQARGALSRLLGRLFGSGRTIYGPTNTNQPLEGWRLVEDDKDVKELGKEAIWKFEGNGKCDLPDRAMREDRLGPFEIQLLKKDFEFTKQIIFTDYGWRWLKNGEQVEVVSNASHAETSEEQRRSHTMPVVRD